LAEKAPRHANGKEEYRLPTIITHAVVAGVAGVTIAEKPMLSRFWLVALLCSTIPDADIIGFAIGIKYGDFLGHRGFFHSIFFALVLSIGLVLIFFKDYQLFSVRWWKSVLFFFIVGASHGILDAFTDGGLGVALLAPFDNTRYFFPWTPIMVSPIRLTNFLSYWGLRVIIHEILYIWLPLLLMCIGLGRVIIKLGN
jgi:inner membrane protein